MLYGIVSLVVFVFYIAVIVLGFVCLFKIANAMGRIADGIHTLAEKHDGMKRELEDMKGKE